MITCFLILYLQLFLGIWFSAFCRSRLIAGLMTTVLTFGFLFYFFGLSGRDASNYRFYIPYLTWIPLLIIWVWSSFRMVANRFNLPEGTPYRMRHFLLVLGTGLLLFFVVHPVGQILAVPKVKGTVMPDAALITVRPEDRFIDTDSWTPISKLREMVKTPNVEMVKELERQYDKALESFKNRTTTVQQTICFIESNICAVLLETLPRLDKESLIRAESLLERMATERPEGDVQLMKFYSLCYQYNGDPTRFDSSHQVFNGFRSSQYEWWRNIQYRHVLWNELQDLTPKLQLAQKTYLSKEGRADDADIRVLWFSKHWLQWDNVDNPVDENRIRKANQAEQYDRWFEHATLDGGWFGDIQQMVESEVFRRGMIVLLATRRYQLEKGELPDSVETLVKAGYLKETPTGPGVGRPITLAKKDNEPYIVPEKSGEKDGGGDVVTEKLRFFQLSDDNPEWWPVEDFRKSLMYKYTCTAGGVFPNKRVVSTDRQPREAKIVYFTERCIAIPTKCPDKIIYTLPLTDLIKKE